MRWPTYKLGRLCSVVTKGTTPRTLGKEYVSTGIPFLRAENLQGDEIVLDNNTFFIDEDTNILLSRSIIFPGDVLISIAGTIGRCAIVPGNAQIMNCNQAVAIVRISGPLERRYLLHWLKTSDAQMQMKGAKVTQTISNLSLTQINDLKVPLPPISEQRRIVEILDQADRLRKLRADADAKTTRILPALFYKMFGDPISNPYRLPTESVGNLLTLFKNGTTAAQNQEGRGYPVTRIETISEGLINPERVHYVEINDEEIDKWLLEPGDILFSHINSESHIGKTAIYKGSPSLLIHGMNLLLMRPDTTKVLPEYLFALLNADSVRTAYRQRCKRAVNQASLNQQDISVLKVAIALKQLQERFCQLANGLLMQIQTQKKVLRNFESLFNNLLHYAFNGDLTAKWREGHMKKLMLEMEAQAKLLKIS